MTAPNVVLENEHFRLDELAEGIYVAIATLEGGAMSNAGIVDLGDETLVFDAFLTRAAAKELRDAAEQVTGRAPRYLVNSHFHGDHVLGNCVFLPEAAIFASSGTTATMTAHDDSSDEEDRAELAASIEQMERVLADETDEPNRINYEGNLYPRKRLFDELPVIRVLPTVVFEGTLEVRGSGRTVRLVASDRAHTEGDVHLLCPDDRVVFLGDLGFFEDLPAYVAPQGDATAWAAALREFESLAADAFVPGHGDVGGVPELAAQCGFLDAAVEAAREVAAGGGTVDGVVERMRETEYARWEKTTLYRPSLEAVLQRTMASA